MTKIPELQKRELPQPIPLRKMLGPSVVLLALGLGSGEFILWPNIVAKYGFVCIWAAFLGLLMQYFINMEIERWTLAKGESAAIGFCRISSHFAWLFILFSTIPFIWPGWVTSASLCLKFATGISHVYASIVSLIFIGVILTLSPVIYKTVEKIQMFLVGFVVISLIILVSIFFNLDSLFAWFKGLTAVGKIPADIEWTLFLSALAYAGLGGSGNLVQSNYIREKGYAMGVYTAKVLNPLSGKEEALSDTGYEFELSEKNITSWKKWWRNANIEHFICFFLLGFVTISLLAFLSYSTVFGRTDLGKEFDFICKEGQVIGERVGSSFQYLFYLIGFAVLFTTELGILDLVSRITTDIIKVNYLRDSLKWNQSKIYFVILWLLIVISIAIITTVSSQPKFLLIIGACMNATIMALYTPLLIYMNIKNLAKPLQPTKIRILILIFAFFFYSYFSYITVSKILF